MQVAFRIENLDGKIIVVPGHAGDLRAIQRGGSHSLVAVGDAGAGLQEPFPQLGDRVQRAGVGEVRAEEAAAAVDHMATGAASLPKEDGGAGLRIAG